MIGLSGLAETVAAVLVEYRQWLTQSSVQSTLNKSVKIPRQDNEDDDVDAIRTSSFSSTLKKGSGKQDEQIRTLGLGKMTQKSNKHRRSFHMKMSRVTEVSEHDTQTEIAMTDPLWGSKESSGI